MTTPVSRTFVDLSHDVEHGMTTYKGIPAPVVCDFLSREQSRGVYAEGVEFHIGRIDMVANTGTYVDSPFHRYANGKDLASLPLESLADLESVVVEARGRSGRSPSCEPRRPLGGSAVSRGLGVPGAAARCPQPAQPPSSGKSCRFTATTRSGGRDSAITARMFWK
ncbi:cyclase family protein [Sorangium sp. So ce448]|uniref:cyclase family protein n=1 Tax=Sorangium sp. So ce448 TaxID=3133314 RepID=UPI003F5FEFFF